MNLINFLRSTSKVYVLFGILFLVVIFIIIFVITNIKNQPAPSTTILPTPTRQPIIRPAEKLYPAFKTIINQTTDQEISKLSNIKKVVNLPDGKTQYLLDSKLMARDNTIITQNGVAIFERIIKIEENSNQYPLSYYKKKYGNPEKVIKGSKFYGIHETVYIYASQGFTLIANPFTEAVDEIQAYAPISVDQYLKTWGEDIKENWEDQGP